MKVILEFDGIEERHEALQAQHAVDYLVALERIQAEMRRRWKYVEHETEEARGLASDLYRFVCNEVAELPETGL